MKLYYLMSLLITLNLFCEIDLTVNNNELQIVRKFGDCAYSTLETLCNSYAIAREIIRNGIEGDFVECGVAGGSQVAAMAWANQIFSGNKTIHLFDSFEGIPLAGPNDNDQPGLGKITHDTSVPLEDLLVSSGVAACSLENVKRNMSRWGIDHQFLEFHKGWFQNTLPHIASSLKKIAFLRLDGDLYESTKVCLEYLYPRVVKGGFVVIDDWNLIGCRKAVFEYLASHNLKPHIKKVKEGQSPVYWQVN
jgi:O-methyltransferase